MTLAPLAGGLANAFPSSPTTVQEKFVVRCGDDMSSPSCLPRPRARNLARRLRGRSVPEVVNIEPGITVLRFIAGRTLDETDLRAKIARIVPLIENLPPPRSAATCRDRPTCSGCTT